MSLERAIDAVVRCNRCGKRGFMACDCWRECTCGLIVAADENCGHPVHQSSMLLFGYWVIDHNTGRPFKTRSHSPRWIRKRMDEGTAYATRKEANDAVRAAAAEVKRGKRR